MARYSPRRSMIGVPVETNSDDCFSLVSVLGPALWKVFPFSSFAFSSVKDSIFLSFAFEF